MYRLEPSPRSEKKWRITTPEGKKVDFGSKPYSDYTIHMDSDRKDRYINRHEARENWEKSGIGTAGFWSRWLLWNLPDFAQSVKDIEKRFNISIDTSSVKVNSDGSSISFGKKIRVPTAGSSTSILPQPLPSLNTLPLPSLNTLPLPSLNTLPLPSLNTLPLPSNPSLNTLPKPLPSLNTLPLPSNPSLGTNSEYADCLIEAAKRKEKGELKLCPEGYCTAKMKFEVYPSAYANGYAAQVCKGTQPDLNGNTINHYGKTVKPDNTELDRWFKEEWVNVCEPGYPPCGRSKANLDDSSKYPYCRPKNKLPGTTVKTVSELTLDQINQMCQTKRSLEQGIDGKPTRVYI